MSVGSLTSQNIFQIQSNTISISNGVDSSSTSTGALIVDGGASITKNLSVGGILNLDGGLEVAGDFDISGNVTINETNDSTSSTTGCLVLSGGLGVAKNSYFGGDVYVTGNLTTKSISYETSEVITSSADSTSISTGASVIVGGCGIGLNLNVGGVVGATNTSNSTSTSTGSIIVGGGVGIAKSLYVGDGIYGDIRGSFITTTVDSTSSSTGSFIVNGGLGVAKNIFSGAKISSISSEVTGGVASTDYTTGSLIITGGVGVSNNVNVFGNLGVSGSSNLKTCTISSTVVSTNTASGALQVAGGVGIASNTYIGGDLFLGDTVTNFKKLRVSNGVSAGNDFTYLSSNTANTSLMFNGYFTNATGGTITVPDNTNTSAGVTLTSTNVNILSSQAGGTQPTLRWGINSTGERLYNNTDPLKYCDMSVDTGGDYHINAGGNDVYFDNTDIVHVQSTAVASDTQTGALIVSGGVGVGGKLYADSIDTLTVSHSLATSLVTNTNSSYTKMMCGTANLYLYGEAHSIEPAHLRTSGVTSLIVPATTASSDTLTGALQIVGGAGIGGKMYVGGDTKISSTTASSNTATGALQVLGGAGIAGSLSASLIKQSTTSWEDVNLVISPSTGGNFAVLTQIDSTGLYSYVFPSGGGNSKFITGNGQLPHSSETGASYSVYPHVHLYADTTNSNSASFTFSYQFINVGATSAISLTASTVTLPSPITANTHYMLELTASGISLNGVTGSSVLMWKLLRSNVDAYTGNLFVIGLDMHYPMQRLGDSTITP